MLSCFPGCPKYRRDDVQCTEGSASVLTVRALLPLRSALRTGEQHLGGGAAIGHVHVQPGQGDGVLDDGRDGGWRRRRRVLGGVASGSAVR